MEIFQNYEQNYVPTNRDKVEIETAAKQILGDFIIPNRDSKNREEQAIS